MALPFPIADTQTDAKSPIDQQLMDALRLNQEFLDDELATAGEGGVPIFKVNGYLNRIKTLLDIGAGSHVDGGPITVATTFLGASLYLEKPGTSGALEVDVLAYKELQHGIVSISASYADTVQAIGRLGAPLPTLAISLATPDISTQSIALAKPTLNVISVSKIGSETLYVFSGGGLLDEDYQVGVGTVVITGCATPANNGTFAITAVNYDGLASVLVDNAAGVTEVTAGAVELQLFELTYLAAVNDNFTPGEIATFSGHTNPVNNDDLPIYKINQAGNNIWVYNGPGVVQAGVAGVAKTNRFIYTYAALVDDTQYIVGELAFSAGHTSGGNNGPLTIRGVNVGGNNIKFYNHHITGSIQAGAAGTMDTLRWLYAMPTDPTGEILVGETVAITGCTTPANNGSFIVTTVNRFAANNIEIYNQNGVAQAGVAGTLAAIKKIVEFAEDFSAFYTAGTSKASFEGIVTSEDPATVYDIIDVNLGIGQFNIVIDNAQNISVNPSAQGRVSHEVKSIFTQRPRISIDTTISARGLHIDTSAVMAPAAVAAGSILSMNILEIPEGLPSSMTLTLK